LKNSLASTVDHSKATRRGAKTECRRLGWLALIGLALILAACSASSTQASGITPSPVSSTTPTPTQTPTPTATFTALPPTATPSATPTPTPLEIFRAPSLLKEVTPVTYLTDACQALYDRWDSEKAEPGTMVVPVMFHSVVKDGRALVDNMSVHEADLKAFMEAAKQLGYETITTAQLLDFLQNNTRIPARSLLLIIDDRRQGVVWNNFMPYLQLYDWKITMAYITGPVVSDWEWGELKRLDETGYVDVQAHGYLHNGESYITEYTAPEIVTQELAEPIKQIEKYLGETPIAFIWPGGNYTPQSVAEAREVGYQLGFTVRARGPLLFNWIPQGDEELTSGDALMTLPRYWSTNAYNALYDAIQVSDEVRQNAEDQKASELAWYAQYCSGYPAIP
jgi:peptidoglycan/xylan/chitin deacetylase (PgdA/CDA1 family)